MRKLLIIVFILLLNTSVYSKWIYSEKVDNYLWLDEEHNKIQINSYFWASENEEIDKLYYAGKYGFIYINKKIDEVYSTNEKGEVLKNGEVVIRNKKKRTTTTEETTQNITQNTIKQAETTIKVVETTQTIQTTPVIIQTPQIVPSEQTNTSNVIYAQNQTISNSQSVGRLLKNYIKEKQNVDIINEKDINGNKRTNVIQFKSNGAFVTLDTKRFNKINIKVEKEKYFDVDNISLSLVVNGIVADEIEFEENKYEAEQEFEYSINDDVDLVLNTTSTSNNIGFYIITGRMSKYKEDEEGE